MDLSWYVIHLPRAVERVGLLDQMRLIFGEQLLLLNASDGSASWANTAIPKKHPLGTQIEQGNIGCTESHLAILSRGQQVGILEDDCEFLAGKDSVRAYLEVATRLYPEWDIVLLGASEYVESSLGRSGLVCEVQRFWGTHAMLVSRKAVAAIQRAYHAGLERGVYYPADWLYNTAIKESGLVVIGPRNPKMLCQQKVGLVSAVTGKVRL
jgi:GR25 family glycosyltransferase involved in LPS biosynthesis